MKTSRVLTACAVSLALCAAACGSDSDDGTATTSTSTTRPLVTSAPQDSAATSCPTAEPDAAAAPQWTFAGDTGSISVVGPTDATVPRVDVQAPFAVATTQVQTLTPGDGPIVSDTAEVSVCYQGVNGRDGSVFDSSFERGAPVEFPLTGVVPGFTKAIAGQTVGSTVAVAVTSADGYPDGNPRAGIEQGDSLIFTITILDVTG